LYTAILFLCINAGNIVGTIIGIILGFYVGFAFRDKRLAEEKRRKISTRSCQLKKLLLQKTIEECYYETFEGSNDSFTSS